MKNLFIIRKLDLVVLIPTLFVWFSLLAMRLYRHFALDFNVPILWIFLIALAFIDFIYTFGFPVVIIFSSLMAAKGFSSWYYIAFAVISYIVFLLFRAKLTDGLIPHV